jgi:hypothetical protein
MSQLSSFYPQTATVCVVTSATPSTATSNTINFPLQVGGVTIGLSGHRCSQVRVRGALGNTADVFMSITTQGGADTATIPVAGTPSQEMPIAPNSVETLTFTPGHDLSVNIISSVASQILYLTFGEGL